jgi:hypothetical protein
MVFILDKDASKHVLFLVKQTFEMGSRFDGWQNGSLFGNCCLVESVWAFKKQTQQAEQPAFLSIANF